MLTCICLYLRIALICFVLFVNIEHAFIVSIVNINCVNQFRLLRI